MYTKTESILDFKKEKQKQQTHTHTHTHTHKYETKQYFEKKKKKKKKKTNQLELFQNGETDQQVLQFREVLVYTTTMLQ